MKSTKRKRLTLACRFREKRGKSEANFQRKGSINVVVSWWKSIGQGEEKKSQRKREWKRRTQARRARSAILTFAGRTSDEVWEVETDLTRVSLTRAADQGKPLWVFQAEVEGDLALGGGDHVGVGEAHLQLKVVLCFVSETISEYIER